MQLQRATSMAARGFYPPAGVCRSLASAAVLLLSACSSMSSVSSLEFAQPEQGWGTSLRAEHPLVGRIWESSTGKFLDRSELMAALESKRFVLLGEKHDNPDHHALQLEVIAHFIDSGSLSGLSFEMLTSAMTPRLRTLASRTFDNPQALAQYLEWDDEGWDWDFYGPMVWEAYRSKVRISAANISRSEMSVLYAQELPVAEGVIDLEGQALLRADIDVSHCGLLPESQFDAMVRVQQGRDQSMARSLLSHERDEGTGVLVAGKYHVRQDIGVPNYLLAQDESLSRREVASLAFLEVAGGEVSPESYLEQSGAHLSYDYLWFTPALSDKDYCAGFGANSNE